MSLWPLLVALPFVGGFVVWLVGRVRASAAAKAAEWKMAPTPESARVAVEVAQQQAKQEAKEAAHAVATASDDAVQKRIDELRERGRVALGDPARGAVRGVEHTSVGMRPKPDGSK